MKWTVAELHKYQHDVMELDETINVNKVLQKENPDIRDVSPVHVKGIADIDARKVTFHLVITGTFILPCSRTLADARYPFRISSAETFLLNPALYNDEAEMTHVVEGGVVDLMPVIYELLLLEVPMQIFSEEAQANTKLPAGKGWEVLTEEQLAKAREQEKEKVDPRLAGLAKLLEENKDTQK